MTSPEATHEEHIEVVYCHRRNCPGSTGLRCYQTGVPICMKCSIRTPVGYISKDAAKARADQYYNMTKLDYLIAATVAFWSVVLIGFPLVVLLGGIWLIMIFAGPAVGSMIGEVVFRAIRRRRGRHTVKVVVGAMAGACFALLLMTGNIFGVILFAAFTIGTALTRLRVAL